MVKRGQRAKTLASLASYYDALRNEVVVDPERIFKMTKEIGGDRKYWKRFSKEAGRVVGRLRGSERIRRTLRAARIMELITLIYFMAVMILAFSLERGILNQNDPIVRPFLIILSPPSIIALLVLASATLLVLSIFRYQIKARMGEGERIDRMAKQRLREAAQYYINELARTIRNNNLNPEKYRLKLRNLDYDGIKVVGEPNIFREYYLAVVDIRRASGSGKVSQKSKKG